MDGFTPGWGGCCCEMDGCACESCAMGGARDSCAAWREHYYWNHTSDDKKQFLVVASGDVAHSLRIPLEVGSHLRNMIPESDIVKLEAPNRRVYPVEVSRDVGFVVLRPGWNQFVDAYHIEEDNSILFVYRGNSCFKVNVFNSTGHEKYLSYSPLPSGIFEHVPPFAPSNHHVQNEQVVPNPGHVQTSIDIVYTTWCHLTKAQDDKVLEIANTRKSEIPLHVAAMKQKKCQLEGLLCFIDMSSSDDDDIVREGTRESCRAPKRATRRCAKTQKMASTSSPSTKSGYGAHKPYDRASLKLGVGSEPLSNNLWWPSQRPYIIAQGKPLPSQVEMKVVEKVQAIRSELPIYVKVMTTTNVDIIGTTPPEMTFSMRYGSVCLPDKTQPLFLKMEGKTKVWPATLSVTSRKQRQVYSGWKEFVEDNHLKAGEICLFELASSNAGSLTPTMTVHLIRKSEAQM